ncbi:DUF4926 domain-containing protein [Methylorubrum sp. SL192]|uniref:DUF4926 domain-containing protein n=2 Tax=Methylorubrum extorquens TaxID=408 RepID=A0A1S1NWY1_METEX|nr:MULTISPECIES: DUF4926 domain-containing protein [Methylobacteriaceae]ABY32852.1 hypothetical protein Mext_4484 [Methylorubrum extorquens PA1]KQP86096.1 hypothetical protein ASF55_12830 [Methylobacterium sp. Leaf119]OHV15208.1 DUF4926 domain-containing protein [Methylorubrum extorquens]KQQ12783.1 hypothetical protein ASF56_06415 [Methylobacterium sp. Leaf122]MCY1644184.1 DUF4926 domain-containing protein [Methylorubrum sp. SL192]
MSVEVVYQWSEDCPGAALRELDDVRVLTDVVTMDGDTIPAGTEGTVVAVWRGGEAYEVEFPEPMGALATVGASNVAFAGRPVP